MLKNYIMPDGLTNIAGEVVILIPKTLKQIFVLKIGKP